MFWVKCGYRGSRWYAHENLVNCVEGHNLRVSMKACNWNIGTRAWSVHRDVIVSLWENGLNPIGMAVNWDRGLCRVRMPRVSDFMQLVTADCRLVLDNYGGLVYSAECVWRLVAAWACITSYKVLQVSDTRLLTLVWSTFTSQRRRACTRLYGSSARTYGPSARSYGC